MGKPWNLMVRVGVDASGYNKGMDKLKAKAEKDGKDISEKLADSSSENSIKERWAKSQVVAKGQAGTTLSDRIGTMLNGSGNELITEIDINNIAEARRQAQDLSAMITKLRAKGAHEGAGKAEDVEKYRKIIPLYEAVSAAIDDYDNSLREQLEAERQAKAAAIEQAQAQEQAAASTWRTGTAGMTLSQRLRVAAGDLGRYVQSLFSTREAGEDAESSISRLSRAATTTARVTGYLAKEGSRLVRLPFRLLNNGVSLIRRMGESAKSSTNGISSMVRSIRNISAVSFGLRMAGAAFGRLRSIVSEYISTNDALQAQVNGLKAGLGQALAPAINGVIGLFSQLMPYVLGVANAIGSLFGMLFGGVWNKAAAGASKTAAATGSAAKAQKELNNQLLGFDQITRLEGNDSADSSGSGGGGGGAAIAPIEAKTPAWMERFKSSFSDLFNSDEFKAANIGGKLGMSLQTGLDWLGGEAMNFNWNGAGQKLRANWDSFWNSGAVESLGRTVGIALAGIGDLIIGFMGPAWDEMGQAWQNEGVQGILVYIGGMTTAGLGKLTSGLFTRLLSPMFQGMADFFKEHGHESLAGFFQGLADKCKTIGQDIKTHFVDPIVNGVKNLLGIHSPSTVFAGFAESCVEGFVQKFDDLKSKITEKFTSIKQKITETANGIKNAFQFNWQIPQIKLPHLQVDWVEAGGLLSRFLGVSHVPSLSVQWFAKGAILSGAQLFGAAGKKLLGGGEAGREAVLPLEQNTGWMDEIAERVAARLGDGADVTAVINLLLDGDPIITKVIKKLRAQAKANGQPVWG